MKLRKFGIAAKDGEDARQGVTGHNVRYVLAFGLAGIVGAFIIVAIFYGTGSL